MKKIIVFLALIALSFSIRAQFPGTDSLRNYNNRFITNNAQAAFTNLRLHNLLAGVIDWEDSARLGAGGTLGVDTIYAVNDSTIRYRKSGVFRTFIIRGTAWAGKIYEVPFSNGFGRFLRDSNFVYSNATPDAGNLTVGPLNVISGGLSKVNITSDNMNALALTAFGTGLNTVIARRGNGTVASPTSVLNGNDLWNFSGRGYTGTQWSGTRAGFYSRANQNWTDSTQGTFISFQTTHNDSIVPYDRFIIDHDGHVALPTYSYLTQVTDTATYKPLVYNKNTGYLQPFSNWHMDHDALNYELSANKSLSPYTLNFTSGDSLYRLTSVAADTSTHITQDSLGIRVIRSSNATNVWDNRFILSNYGQSWTNSWNQTIVFVPNFDPSATVHQIGFGITNIGDCELNTTPMYFGFMVKLGLDSSTSGYQGAVSTSIATNDYYAQRLYSGLIWQKGDRIQLNIQEKDRNQFLMTLVNLDRNSKVSGYLNYPLPNSNDPKGYTHNVGYPSMYYDGGDFTIKNYTFDPQVTGVQLLWVSNSIGYGYGLDSLTKNNNYYTTWNIVRDNLPFKSALLARAGTTTGDVTKVIKEISLYKPKFVVLDGIQTNDFFVSFNDVVTSEVKYLALVKKLKAQGINVIHFVAAPRGSVNPSQYHTFQLDAKNWILSTFPNDIIINDFDSLLRPGTVNTLDSSYFFTGDGTHLNVKGHAKRAADFLAKINFEFFKGQVTRLNSDTVVSGITTVGTGAAPSNAFSLEVQGATKTDSLIGGTTASDSIYFTTTRNATKGKFLFGSKFQITESTGIVGLGQFTSAQTPNAYFHIRDKSAGTVGIIVENDSTRNGAAARYGLQNDVADFAQIYLGSSINAFVPRILNINNGPGIGISSGGNIMFGTNAIFTSPWSVVTATLTSAGNFGIGPALVAPTDRLHVLGTAKITDTLKTPNIIQKGFDTTNLKLEVVDASGNHFKSYWPSYSSITSINSQTGPAYTISTGLGLASSLGANSITISVDNNSTDISHVVDKQFTDANNSSTTETDLYSKSIAANTLINNGASIHFDVTGQLNDATATADIQFYFGGTSFGNTGALTLSTTGAWSARGYVIRATSTTARAFVTFTTQSASAASYTFETDLTGLDFTTGNILKVTGQAGGATGGSNDITAKTWKLIFQP